MTCDLQSPDNADTASWNNYPLDAEEQLRSLAERKRIVVPRVYVVVVRRRRRYVTRRRRYAILFYFRKLNLHYVLQQKFENDSSSYRKLEDCTLHIVHVLHTLHICDVQPKHCTAHSYCG